MAYAYPEIKEFNGLYLQKNSFNVPDGALEEAENVFIQRDGIITKRRGFYEYYEPGSFFVKNLILYDTKLIAVLADRVQVYTDTGTSPNETGNAADFSGATVAVTGDRVPRFAQANKNLYFTTDNGVQKIESSDDSLSDVSGVGTPPALDMMAALFVGTVAPFQGNSQVNYRVIFGRRDNNDNLILGAPSDFLALSNIATTSAWTLPGGATVRVAAASHTFSVSDIVRIENAGDVNIPDGTYTVTAISAGVYFEFTAPATPTTPDNLTWSQDKTARIEFSVPSEITDGDGFFFQIYRTEISDSASDDAGSTYKFVEERELTSAEITAGRAFYEDYIDEILLGAELYTNANSREGELNANNRPPLCDDIAFYKNHIAYAKATARHLITLDVVDTSSISAGDIVEVTVDATTRSYIAGTDVENQTVAATSVAGSGTLTITYAGHGFVNGDFVYISNVTGGAFAEGEYEVSGVAGNDFDITGVGAATGLDFSGTRNAAGERFFYLNSGSSSISVRLRDTAQHLVKAINRDPSSDIYARYVSAPVGDVPGKMRFQAKGFGGAIQLSVDAGGGAAFSPALTTTATDNQSEAEDQPNAIFFSKLQEPEAVPLLNSLKIGASNAAILAVRALRDSLIVLKEDGVYRVTGDTFSSFTATPLDTTVVCRAPSSVKVLNNQVIFLSNQGVCLVTESTVQIISRVIEDVIQPILTKDDLENETSAVAYESERLYLLSTLDLNETTNTQVYAYNILNDTWTTWDKTFDQGAVGPNDTLYLVSTGGEIVRERKKQTLIDFCEQNYPTTVNTVPTDTTANITISAIVPRIGDVIVKNDAFNRISAVSGTGPAYDVTFESPTNLEAADTPIYYSQYTSTIKLAPFHAGAVGRMKQFAQMQCHFKNSEPGKLTVSFQSYTFGGSETVEWVNPLSFAGWGFFPWGFVAWGQEEGISLTQFTRAAAVCRVYVPRFAQRTTFLQPVIEHNGAGEQINLQAITFAVRPYRERVSK